MTYFEYFQAFLIFLAIVIPISLLVLYGFAFLVEIPEWFRSWKLYKIAKKYNLQFIRAKNGWLNGWISLRAGERNIISGNINGFLVNFSDMTLIEGTLIFGDKPSIAIQGSEWDLNKTTGQGLSRGVSKLNDHVYHTLSIRSLLSLFEKIADNKITQNSEIFEMFRTKDFSKHTMMNYSMAGFVTAFVFMILLLLTSNISPEFFGANENFVVFIIIVVCIPVFIFSAWKSGKKFSPDEISKYPGQDEIETKIRTLNSDPDRKPVEMKEFKFDWRHKTLLFIFVVSMFISSMTFLIFVSFLMSKVLNYDVVSGFSTGRYSFVYWFLKDYPWITVIAFVVTIIGLVKMRVGRQAKK